MPTPKTPTMARVTGLVRFIALFLQSLRDEAGASSATRRITRVDYRTSTGTIQFANASKRL
jgi:hypothetical protein